MREIQVPRNFQLTTFFLSPLFPRIIKLQLDEGENERERKERDGIQIWVTSDASEVAVLSKARRGSFGLAMVV